MRTDSSRRRGALRGALFLLCAALLASLMGPVLGQSAGHAISISPVESLVDSQYIAVSFSGFPASRDIRIRQCPKKAKRVTQCKKDSQYAPILRESGDHRLPFANASGGGSETFIIKAGEMDDAEGGSFTCDIKHDCNIVGFELDPADFTELGFDHAAVAEIPFARSTLTCPKPTGAGRIAGSGTTNIASDIVEWQAETCGKELGLRLSYIVTNSPQGKEAYLAGLTDSEFAISSIPLKEHEKQHLVAAQRDPLQIPLAVGSLSFIFNYWEDFDRCDSDDVKERVTTLRMSPRTLALVLTGRVSDMSDQAIADDNPDLVSRTKLKQSGQCVEPGRLPGKAIRPVVRADNSSATWILSSWMLTVAHDAWASAGPDFAAPSEIFPSYNAVDLRTGSSAVARQVRTFEGGQQVVGIPQDLWIGMVDTSVAKLVGLPSVAVKNGAGEFVSPTPETMRAGLEAATLNADGTVTPNYGATAPANAYPLPVVSYLITDKTGLSAAQASTMKAFAAYAITDGQVAAEDRGYIPLPAEMQATSSSLIDQIEGAPSAGGGNDDGDDDGGNDDPGDGNGSGSGFSDDDDEDVHGFDDDSDLEDFTDGLLARARGGGSGGGTAGGSVIAAADASSGPIESGGLASQIGTEGGPAGVVRALTVFLGLPMLIALGFGTIVGGRALSAFSVASGHRVRSFLPRWVWRPEI